MINNGKDATVAVEHRTLAPGLHIGDRYRPSLAFSPAGEIRASAGSAAERALHSSGSSTVDVDGGEGV
jgi:hypothetical protein